MKTFKYKEYENCYFIVSNYLDCKNAMAIIIYNDDDGQISTCTTYIKDYIYEKLVTIKNYSENSKMTEFLQELGVVEKIQYRVACNVFPETLASLETDNPQTIDVCKINMNKLKEYSKVWDYNGYA